MPRTVSVLLAASVKPATCTRVHPCHGHVHAHSLLRIMLHLPVDTKLLGAPAGRSSLQGRTPHPKHSH